MYESKRDNRLRKTWWCPHIFSHLSAASITGDTKNIVKTPAHPKLEQWESRRLYSSPYYYGPIDRRRVLWRVRVGEDQRKCREGAGIAMESIEEKTQFECLFLNWTNFLVKWSLIRPTIVLTFHLKSLKYFRNCLIHFSVLWQIPTIKTIHDKLNPVTRCVHRRSNASTCKCQWRLKIAVESD